MPQPLREPSSRRWLLELTLLYAAEGLPFGFFAQGIPVVARQQGASLTKVGLLFLLYLPWALKALWAPLVDSWHVPGVGRRRTWILGTQLAMVACLLVTSAVARDSPFLALLPLVVVINLLSATQDIAVDGYAVSRLTAQTRGLGNAIQVCGYKLGMVASGGPLLWLADRAGFSVALLVLAILVGLITPVSARLQEPPGEEAAATSTGTVAREAWRHLVKRRGAAALLLLCVVVKMGESAAGAMVKPALVDRGFTLTDVAVWVGTWGLLASLVGSAAGGLLVTALSRAHALAWAILLQAAGLAILGPLLEASRDVLGLAIVLEHLVTGVLTTVLFTFMMDAVDPRFGGTEYTVLASAVVLGTGLAPPLGGLLAEHLGYGPLFLGAAGLTVASLSLLPRARHALRDK